MNFIEIEEFPRSVVHHVTPPNDVWWELESRLVLVYLVYPWPWRTAVVASPPVAARARAAG